jgi:hypothetical protein
MVLDIKFLFVNALIYNFLVKVFLADNPSFGLYHPF